MQHFVLSDKTKKILWWGLLFALIARLVCNALIPLTDTSEARYAEIARKMLETGDWITPQHDYGVPFWAKPPLSTWLSAASMKLFGVNEFAARLPSTLLGIGTLVLIWLWCVSYRGRDFALGTCAVLAGMSLFFMADGAVMTDTSLVFCTTLTMVAFWRAVHGDNSSAPNQKLWGYLFFVGLGVGLSAKGPLVGVLTFMPIVPWLFLRNHGRNRGSQLQKNWRQVWRALPWIRGSLLMLAIGLPWYLIAEHKTPGFLAYFIWGEHFGRFLNPGWNGDRYGHAHTEALGMIWAFWVMAALPWSFIFIAKLIAKRKELFRRDRTQNSTTEGWLSYLLLWSFMPLVFFTFAHNTIWTYPLPALPAFAVLMVELLARSKNPNPFGVRLAALNFFTPIVMLIVAALYASGHDDGLKASQKESAAYYLKMRPGSESGLYYYDHRYYSGEFYSAGKAKMIENNHLPDLLTNGHTDFLIIHASDLKQLSPELRSHFKTQQKFGKFVLLEEADSLIAARQQPNTLTQRN